MEWLAALQETALARALRTSFHAYPLVNVAHIAVAGALTAAVLAMHARAAGAMQALERTAFERIFRRIALALFVAAAATGLALFSVKAAGYAENPAFRIKLALIAAASVNFLAWRWLPRWRFAGAVASVLLWPAILVAGRYIGFV